MLSYYLNGFEMVPVASVITGITLIFACHVRSISIVRPFIMVIIVVIQLGDI